MDIAAVVVYEHVHELKVTFPNSDRYLGLRMGIRNASSEASKAAMRRQENERQKSSRNKQKKMSAEVQEQNELELTAATIAWWKWEKGDPSEKSKAAMALARAAGKSDDEIAALDDSSVAQYNGAQPELSMPVAVEILDKVSFIYAQVKGASIDVENFMTNGSAG